MVTILHTEASPGWGGQEIRILRECLAFKKKGYRVLLAVNPKSELLQRARLEGLEVIGVPFSYASLATCLKILIPLLKKEDISLINTHSSVDAWVMGVLGKCFSIPVVRTRHLSTQIKGGLNSRLLYNYLADRVVTTCQEVVPMIQKQAGLDEKRCLSIPTGIAQESMCVDQEAQEAFRKKYNITDKQLVVGSCCIMRKWKGLLYLLKAAQKLKAFEHIRFILVGGGVSLDYYKEQAQQLGVLDQVTFTGHLENPLVAISCMDIFTLLSTGHEGVSQASLQAAYLGKPLIATATGGLKEVCVSNKTGIEVETHNADQVASAIRNLDLDEEKRLRFGQAAKQLVEEKFLFQKTVEDMEKVFLGAIH